MCRSCDWGLAIQCHDASPLPHGVALSDSGEATLPNGQRMVNVHPATACEGRGCPIHHPSDHSMAGFPLYWRSDAYFMERTCPHGIGHPDPDDLAWRVQHWHNADEVLGVHGCDGCCCPWSRADG